MANFIEKTDQDLFVKTLNRKGFILEYKVQKLLKKMVGKSGLGVRNVSPNKVIYFREKRREIDVLFSVKGYRCIVDCKRTEFEWIFARYLENVSSNEHIFMIFDTDSGVNVEGTTNHNKPVVKSDISFMFDSERKLVTNKKDDAKVAYNDVVDHIQQLVIETEALLSERQQDINSKEKERLDFEKLFDVTKKKIPWQRVILPIIVTNARLWLMDIEEKDVDEKGDLINFNEPSEVPFLVYNRPETMLWSSDIKQIQLSTKDLKSINPNMKSFFVVNVNKLEEFVKWLHEF